MPGTKFTKEAQYGLFSGAMAAIGVAVFWGFTVDDAQITARVAHHLAVGRGYRFNSFGPVVDAVTPLGWAHLLTPFGRQGQEAAFEGARALGVLSWISSAVWLGSQVCRRGGALFPLVLLGCLAPVGMWASSGMETGVVTALVTFSLSRTVPALVCLGVAAAWRPELLPFACAWAGLSAGSIRRIPRDVLIAVMPALLVAALRWTYFGSTYPLSVVAKPSDVRLGFWYALEALCWCGPLWLWLAMRWPPLHTLLTRAASVQAAGRDLGVEFGKQKNALALAAAIVVHAIAVTLAGGDWMPGYRLFVPVMPAMLYVACCLNVRRRSLLGVAMLLALSATLRVAFRLFPAGGRIVEQRQLLIRAADSAFANAKVVASPDVGWVGAAFTGPIVDLAGVTDPSVAYLRGGHTSKQIQRQLFIARAVDHVVVLLAPNSPMASPWTDSSFARKIDWRAAKIGEELGCQPTTTLPLAFTTQVYMVLACP